MQRSSRIGERVSELLKIHRLGQQSDGAGLGNQLGQALDPLGCQLDAHAADAGEIATRPGKTGDKTAFDRIDTDLKNNRIVEVASFAAKVAGKFPVTSTSTCRPTSSAANAGN